MLWVSRSDLQDPGNPEILVPLDTALGSVLSAHVHKMIVFVHFTLDCTFIVSTGTKPAQKASKRRASLTDKIIVLLHRLPFGVWRHSVVLVELSLLRCTLSYKGRNLKFGVAGQFVLLTELELRFGV